MIKLKLFYFYVKHRTIFEKMDLLIMALLGFFTPWILLPLLILIAMIVYHIWEYNKIIKEVTDNNQDYLKSILNHLITEMSDALYDYGIYYDFKKQTPTDLFYILSTFNIIIDGKQDKHLQKSSTLHISDNIYHYTNLACRIMRENGTLIRR